MRAELSAPWAVSAPPAHEIPISLIPREPGSKIALFHIPVSGHFWISSPTAGAVRIDAGDVVVLNGKPHTMGDSPKRKAVAIAEVIPRKYSVWPPTVVHGGGGACSQILCGCFKFEKATFNPIWTALPEVYHVKAEEGPPTGWLSESAEYFIREAQQNQPGGESLLNRITELMFIEIIRHRMKTLPKGDTSWLAALNDPIVGRAMRHLHEEPEHPWTVASLASAANTSRSGLAQHFDQLIGEPPMRYLTRWRVHLGAQMLEQTGGGVASIADRVGYQSEAAFTRAFKRHMGMAPVTWLNEKRREVV